MQSLKCPFKACLPYTYVIFSFVHVNGRFVDDSGTWGNGGMFNAIARLSPEVPEAYEAAREAGDLQLADLHLVPISSKLLFSIPLVFHLH